MEATAAKHSNAVKQVLMVNFTALAGSLFFLLQLN